MAPRLETFLEDKILSITQAVVEKKYQESDELCFVSVNW